MSVVLGEGEAVETYPTDPDGLTLTVYPDRSAAFTPRTEV